MGSSKKHKEKDRDREHKHKRRHRSRSRSKSRDRDRSERKHEKKREDKDKERRRRDKDRDGHVEQPKKETPASVYESSGGGENLSLSIAETNKMRAKLGLKPLDLPGSSGGADVKDESKPGAQEDVHVPAKNLAAIKKGEDLRNKMAQLKEKRRLNMMLGKVKKIADSDSDDDAMSWVKKNRKIDEEKKKAEKQAKLLEEMDAEFGIGDLVEEEFNVKKKYTSKDLKGLKVQHDQSSIKEGKSVILTLEDKGVLDEEAVDTLINVNIIDDEKADKNVENKKKKPGYVAYDDKYDEFGELKPREVLDKYDEEIHGAKKKTFQLGSGGKYNTAHEKRMEEMKQEVKNRAETLTLPPPVIASEFYNETEMASFKKIKKKTRKLRKRTKLKANDLLPLAGEPGADMGSRKRRAKREEGEIDDADLAGDVKPDPIPGLDLVQDMDIDKEDLLDEAEILGPEEDLTGVELEEDKAKLELENALRKTHKLKQSKMFKSSFQDADRRLAESIVQEEVPDDDDDAGPWRQEGKIVLNATSEFCRSLGEIPTYGMAGNRPEDEDEIMDYEQELLERQRAAVAAEEDEAGPGWQSVQIDTRPVEIVEEEKAVLDDEPVVNEGLAAALQLAGKKGYLEQQQKKSVSAPKHTDMEAKNYSIEDKRYDDLDEKYRKRDRYMGGAVSDFKEMSNYRPDVKLEYIDEVGRIMNQKEAFRYLSHRFHGKGSGKKKTEKRQKKLEEEQLMKSMSSTDTPLNTVALLTEKQKTEKSPFIVLSGSGKGTASLSK